jgi:hypothetical protein
MGNGKIQTGNLTWEIWHFHLTKFYGYGFNLVSSKTKESTVE